MARVNGLRSIRLRERIKSVRILLTATQFQNNTPSNITLKAMPQNFEAVSYKWYKGDGTTVIGTNQNFVIAHDQVSTIETYKVVVTDNRDREYQDVISITKVIDGPAGRPGQMPVQREWKVGDVYRNNEDVIDYIYHRATETWWRLKPGYNNVTAQINPTIEFIQLNSLEQLAVNLLIAENANIAGFVFKDQKMVSQNPSPDNPNLTLDGVNGLLKALAGQIGGFRIESGNIISNNERLLINGNDGTMSFKDFQLRERIKFGFDVNEIPILQFYDENGAITWEAGTQGIIYANFIAESYPVTRYYRGADATSLTSAIVNSFMNQLKKTQKSYWSSGVTQGPYVEEWTIVNGDSNSVILYGYNAGRNPESEGNKQYEGFFYAGANKLGAKVTNGWYVQTVHFERGYGRRQDFSSPESGGELIYTDPIYTQTFTAVRIVGGKIVSKANFTATVNMASPGPSSSGVAIPYSNVVVGQTVIV